MRDKLIELIDSHCDYVGHVDCTESCASCLADRLLANGVIVLPCKVGDTVYKPVRTFDGEWAIWEVRIAHIASYFGTIGADAFVSYAIGCTQDGSAATIYFDTIGTTVFLSREEAEAALRKEYERK